MGFDDLWGEDTPSSGGSDFDALWDPGSPASAPAASSTGWNLFDAAKQFGAGTIENVAALPGLVADLNPIQPGGPKVFGPDAFQASKLTQDLISPYLPEEDPNYRYSRMIGGFAGPGLALKGLGLAAKGAKALGAIDDIPSIFSQSGPIASFFGVTPRGIAQNVVAGGSAQAAEDVTGNSSVAPILGALLGGGGTSLAIDGSKNLGQLLKAGYKGGKDLLFGPSADDLFAKAGSAFRDFTGLDDAAIAAGVAKRPADALGDLMSTAEVTGSPEMAALELDLAGRPGGPQGAYNTRLLARNEARDALVDAMSPVKAVGEGELGKALLDKGDKALEGMTTLEKDAWNLVPTDEVISIKSVKQAANAALKKHLGAGTDPIDKIVMQQLTKIFDETTDPKLYRKGMEKSAAAAVADHKTSGFLKNVRSEMLKHVRGGLLDERQAAVLSATADAIDAAMKKGLSSADYKLYSNAADATKARVAMFGRGTAGGVLTADTTRNADALPGIFRGDAQSADEVAAVLGGDVALGDKYKRGILDSIPRDLQGNLTPKTTKNFLDKNREGLQKTFEPTHFKNFERVVEDLQSSADVRNLATRSAAGASPTAPRLSVASAIRDGVTMKAFGGAWILRNMFRGVSKALGKDVEGAIENLLMQGALDPAMARKLVQAPTPARIRDSLIGLMTITKNVGKATGRAAVAATARPEHEWAKERAAKPQGGKGLGEALSDLIVAPAEAKELKRPTASKDPTAFVDKAVRRAELVQAGYTPDRVDSAVKDTMSHLFDAMVAQESGGKANAVSEVGAVGLMQVMPDTAKDIAKELGVKKYNLKDPETNRLFGEYYIKKLLTQFDGDVELALTAYHSGPGRVSNLLKIHDASTLKEIKPYLGPVGKKYASGVLDKMTKIIAKSKPSKAQSRRS